MARLFVAAWPPPAVVAELVAALDRAPAPGLRWVPPGSWHVTLRFLGQAEPDEALAALAALDAPPATAVLGPRVTTLGRSIVCVPAAGLDDLAAAVQAATAHVGQPPDPRPFSGHLTLARRKGRRGGPVGAPVAARFEVGEVLLVASDTRPEGAVYQPLAARPLGAGAAG